MIFLIFYISYEILVHSCLYIGIFYFERLNIVALAYTFVSAVKIASLILVDFPSEALDYVIVTNVFLTLLFPSVFNPNLRELLCDILCFFVQVIFTGSPEEDGRYKHVKNIIITPSETSIIAQHFRFPSIQSINAVWLYISCSLATIFTNAVVAIK